MTTQSGYVFVDNAYNSKKTTEVFLNFISSVGNITIGQPKSCTGHLDVSYITYCLTFIPKESESGETLGKVEHRFSDFVSLANHLNKKYGIYIPLSKGVFYSEPKRMQELVHFCNILVSNRELICEDKEVAVFCAVDYNLRPKNIAEEALSIFGEILNAID